MSPRLDFFNWNLGYFFTAAVLGMSAVAIQLFMWCYMVSRFRATPISVETRRVHLVYLAASFAILVLTGAGSILWGLSIYETLLNVAPGEENVSSGWEIVDSVYARLWLKGDLPVNIALWMGDALLVHRCYVIWFNHIWAFSIPLVIWLSSVAVGIVSFIPSIASRTLNIANVFIVVVFHVLVTFLICIRLVHAHRRLYNSFPLAKHNEYLGAIAILVESAAPLTFFGLGTAISGMFTSSILAIKICWIFQTGLWVSSMLAPQLIIFRVTTGRSWAVKSESIAILSRDFEAAVGSLSPQEVKECEETMKKNVLQGSASCSESSLQNA